MKCSNGSNLSRDDKLDELDELDKSIIGIMEGEKNSNADILACSSIKNSNNIISNYIQEKNKNIKYPDIELTEQEKEEVKKEIEEIERVPAAASNSQQQQQQPAADNIGNFYNQFDYNPAIECIIHNLISKIPEEQINELMNSFTNKEKVILIFKIKFIKRNLKNIFVSILNNKREVLIEKILGPIKKLYNNHYFITRLNRYIIINHLDEIIKENDKKENDKKENANRIYLIHSIIPDINQEKKNRVNYCKHGITTGKLTELRTLAKAKKIEDNKKKVNNFARGGTPWLLVAAIVLFIIVYLIQSVKKKAAGPGEGATNEAKKKIPIKEQISNTLSNYKSLITGR